MTEIVGYVLTVSVLSVEDRGDLIKEMVMNFVIEGVDRLGKDTLIKGLQDRFGYFQVLHYVKPLLLEKYLRLATELSEDGRIAAFTEDAIKQEALWLYQRNSFETMFDLLKTSSMRIICNRAHLGEMVYAKRYRGYDGDYVFSIERAANHCDGLSKTILVLLYTSSFSFISDDGMSMDVTKREDEQLDFLEAFDRSCMPNKIKIDVHNGHGKFVTPEIILETVCSKGN